MSINYMTVGQLKEKLDNFDNETLVLVQRHPDYSVGYPDEWDGPAYFCLKKMHEGCDVLKPNGQGAEWEKPFLLISATDPNE